MTTATTDQQPETALLRLVLNKEAGLNRFSDRLISLDRDPPVEPILDEAGRVIGLEYEPFGVFYDGGIVDWDRYVVGWEVRPPVNLAAGAQEGSTGERQPTKTELYGTCEWVMDEETGRTCSKPKAGPDARGCAMWHEEKFKAEMQDEIEQAEEDVRLLIEYYDGLAEKVINDSGGEVADSGRAWTDELMRRSNYALRLDDAIKYLGRALNVSDRDEFRDQVMAQYLD